MDASFTITNPGRMRTIISVFLVLSSLVSSAQFSVGGGVSLGIPFLVDRQGFYNTPSIGIGLDLSYRLPRGSVYPSATIFLNTLQFPVSAENFDALSLTTTARGFNINLNKDLGEPSSNGFTFLAGIGVLQVIPSGNTLSNNASSTNLYLVTEGNSFLYPQINTGFKYRWRASKKHPLYSSLELNLKYVYLYQNGKCFVQNNFLREPANIAGNMLFPSLFYTLNYVFGTEY